MIDGVLNLILLYVSIYIYCLFFFGGGGVLSNTQS